jgi:hypothetical protein
LFFAALEDHAGLDRARGQTIGVPSGLFGKPAVTISSS